MASIGIFNRSHFEPVNASNQTFSSYWRGRSVNDESVRWENISNVVYRILGVIAGGVAAGIGIASLCGVVVYGSAVIIPLGLIAGIFCFAHARKIERAHRVQELEQIRSQIKKLSLSQIAEQFTWGEIFKKGILTPDEFAQAFRAEMRSLTVSSGCAFYETVIREMKYCPKSRYYFVPSLNEFSQKWHQETRSLPFLTIIENYDLDKLHEYGLLSSEEYKILQDLKMELQVAVQERDNVLAQSYPSYSAASNERISQAMAEIDAEYEKQPAVQRLKAMPSLFAHDLAAIRNKHAENVKEANHEHENFVKIHQPTRSFLLLSTLPADTRQQLDEITKRRDQSIHELEIAKQGEIEHYEQDYRKQVLDLTLKVSCIRQEFDRMKQETATKLKDSLSLQLDDPAHRHYLDVVQDLAREYADRRKLTNLSHLV